MKKNLVYNAAFNTLYRLLNVLFPLISATYVSRVLAPAGIGRVAYAQNIISYFLMFAVLGIPEYGTREIAKVRENPSAVNKLFSELIVINSLSTAVCAAAYYLVIQLIFPAEALFYAVLGVELVFNFVNIDWLYQGNEEYVYITLRSIAVKMLSLCCLFIFVKDQSDYMAYGLIHCLGIGCNYLFNVFHVRKRIRLTFRGLNLRQHLGPVFTLMVSVVAASLYCKVDITMLGWMSTEASVGYYTNAHKLVNIVLTLVMAMSSVFLPRLSYVYQNDKASYSKYVSIGLKVVLLLAFPSCVGLLLVASDMTMVMFGGQFLPAASTIRILAVFTIIKGAGDILCYQAIISSGNERKLIKSRVVAGVVNVVLNAMLIPRYAHNGAAVASVVSELIVNGMLLPYALSITQPVVGRRFCVSLAASTAVMAAAVMIAQQLFSGSFASLTSSVLMGMLGYGCMLLATRNDMAEFLLSKAKKRA